MLDGLRQRFVIGVFEVGGSTGLGGLSLELTRCKTYRRGLAGRYDEVLGPLKAF